MNIAATNDIDDGNTIIVCFSFFFSFEIVSSNGFRLEPRHFRRFVFLFTSYDESVYLYMCTSMSARVHI